MAIDFPSNPSDGYEWTDPAGTTWVYSLDKNAWAKVKPDPLDGPYTYPGGVEQTIQARLEQHVSANDICRAPAGALQISLCNDRAS